MHRTSAAREIAHQLAIARSILSQSPSAAIAQPNLRPTVRNSVQLIRDLRVSVACYRQKLRSRAQLKK